MIRNSTLIPSTWIPPPRPLAWLAFSHPSGLSLKVPPQRKLLWSSKHRVGQTQGSLLALCSIIAILCMAIMYNYVCVCEIVLSPLIDSNLVRLRTILGIFTLQTLHPATCHLCSRYLASICSKDRWVSVEYSYLQEFRNLFLCSLILFSNKSRKSSSISIAICKLGNHVNTVIIFWLSVMSLHSWKGEEQ